MSLYQHFNLCFNKVHNRIWVKDILPILRFIQARKSWNSFPDLFSEASTGLYQEITGWHLFHTCWIFLAVFRFQSPASSRTSQYWSNLVSTKKITNHKDTQIDKSLSSSFFQALMMVTEVVLWCFIYAFAFLLLVYGFYPAHHTGSSRVLYYSYCTRNCYQNWSLFQSLSLPIHNLVKRRVSIYCNLLKKLHCSLGCG